MDVIRLRVFPLLVTGEAAIWFTEIPYNSIYTWNQLSDVLLSRYYLESKKLNHKDRVNNSVELSRGSINSSLDSFTSFVRSFPYHHIDDESLEKYFYRGQVVNHKVVLDTIRSGSYRECPYAEINEKLDKISKKINFRELGSQILGETLCSAINIQPSHRWNSWRNGSNKN